MRRLILPALLLVGCGAHLRPEDIDARGSRVFEATEDKAWSAAAAALRSMGYDIALENRERGLLKTNRRLVQVHTSSRSNVSNAGTPNASVTTTTSSTTEFRQYVVEFRREGDNRIRLRVMPRKFFGDREVTDRAVWNLESEEERWNEFFREFSDAL